MKCLQCQTENSNQANFCIECGARFRCPKCGTEASASVKFCSDCGTRLTRPLAQLARRLTWPVIRQVAQEARDKIKFSGFLCRPYLFIDEGVLFTFFFPPVGLWMLFNTLFPFQRLLARCRYKLADVHEKRGNLVKAKEQYARLGAPEKEHWLVLGPFDNHGKEGYHRQYPVEEDDFYVDADYEGINGQLLRWQPLPAILDSFFGGYVDFKAIFEPNEWTVAYAMVYVLIPSARAAQLWLGSDDTLTVWHNGTKLLEREVYRSCNADDDVLPVQLAAGENRFLIKVCQKRRKWGCYLRIVSPTGRPFSDLTYVRAAELIETGKRMFV